MPTRSSRSANRVSLRTQSRAPLTLSRLCSYYFYVKTLCQNSPAPYPNNPLRDGDGDGDGEAFMDVSSFILFLRSEFSSFTVCISSSISVSLVLNSSTNLCRFCSISNVDIFVLMAATAAIDDGVGTPMVMDIMEWNGMEYCSSHK
jgi:hypothetical protein